MGGIGKVDSNILYGTQTALPKSGGKEVIPGERDQSKPTIIFSPLTVAQIIGPSINTDTLNPDYFQKLSDFAVGHYLLEFLNSGIPTSLINLYKELKEDYQKKEFVNSITVFDIIKDPALLKEYLEEVKDLKIDPPFDSAYINFLFCLETFDPSNPESLIKTFKADTSVYKYYKENSYPNLDKMLTFISNDPLLLKALTSKEAEAKVITKKYALALLASLQVYYDYNTRPDVQKEIGQKMVTALSKAFSELQSKYCDDHKINLSEVNTDGVKQSIENLIKSPEVTNKFLEDLSKRFPLQRIPISLAVLKFILNDRETLQVQ